jgi:hypothetical protein
MTFRTREEWLIKAVDILSETVFQPAGLSVPQVRVSVGWPGGKGKKANTVGQCWNASSTEDGRIAVFVSPVLGDRAEILAVLCHELIHAIDDCQSGHRGPFSVMFKQIGMVGKRTQSAVGEDLAGALKEVAKELGAYPHSRMKQPSSASKLGEPKDKNRQLKVACLRCECIIRMTRKWLDEVGPPTCACGGEMGEC